MKIACCLSKPNPDKENLGVITFLADQVDYYDKFGLNKIVENLLPKITQESQNSGFGVYKSFYSDQSTNFNNYDVILSDSIYYEQTAQLIRTNNQAKVVFYAKEANFGIFKIYCHLDYLFCSLEFVREFIGQTVNFYDDSARKKAFDLIKSRFPNTEIIILAGASGLIYAGRKENKREAMIMPLFKERIIPLEEDVVESFTYALTNNYFLEEALTFANIAATISTVTGKRNFYPTIYQITGLMQNMGSHTRIRAK